MKTILFLIVLLSFLKCFAQFESALLGLDSGRPGPSLTSVRASGAHYEKNLNQDQTALSVPVYSSESESLNASVFYNHYHLTVDPFLPRNQVQVPSDLANLQFGVSYKHALEEKKYWLMQMQLGSASDYVFSQADVDTVNLNYVYAAEVQPTHSWLWLVNYSNNRPILNNLPLPGFAYVYTPDAQLRMVVGFPFAFVKWAFADKWNLNFTVFGFTAVKLETSYAVLGPVQIYALLDANQQGFYRRDRDDKEKRLFYDEKKTAVGVRSPISQTFFAEIQTGQAWDRHLFEAQSVAKQGENRIFLDSSWFVQASLSARF